MGTLVNPRRLMQPLSRKQRLTGRLSRKRSLWRKSQCTSEGTLVPLEQTARRGSHGTEEKESKTDSQLSPFA